MEIDTLIGYLKVIQKFKNVEGLNMSMSAQPYPNLGQWPWCNRTMKTKL